MFKQIQLNTLYYLFTKISKNLENALKNKFTPRLLKDHLRNEQHAINNSESIFSSVTPARVTTLHTKNSLREHFPNACFRSLKFTRSCGWKISPFTHR